MTQHLLKKCWGIHKPLWHPVGFELHRICMLQPLGFPDSSRTQKKILQNPDLEQAGHSWSGIFPGLNVPVFKSGIPGIFFRIPDSGSGIPNQVHCFPCQSQWRGFGYWQRISYPVSIYRSLINPQYSDVFIDYLMLIRILALFLCRAYSISSTCLGWWCLPENSCKVPPACVGKAGCAERCFPKFLRCANSKCVEMLPALGYFQKINTQCSQHVPLHWFLCDLSKY